MVTSAEIDFSPIAGQAQVGRFLAATLDSGRLAHGYLFTGPAGTGKRAVAVRFAQVLVCSSGDRRPCGVCASCRQFSSHSHPYVSFIFAHPKSAKEDDLNSLLQTLVSDPYDFSLPWNNPRISIEDIRALRQRMSLKSESGARRVIVILEAQTMTPEATNALLKILEEPPDETYFILTSSAPDTILPTIISRCQQLKFSLLSAADIEKALQQRGAGDAGEIPIIARMARGSMQQALELVSDGISGQSEQTLELLRTCFRPPSSSAQYVTKLVDKHDRKGIATLLESLLYLLRDAWLVASLGDQLDENALTNRDVIDTLRRFAGSYQKFDYPAAIREVERALRMLDRYVQPQLVLMGLIIHINRLSGQS